MREVTMTATTSGKGSAFRAPSGWIPVVLAVVAIGLLAGYLATGPHEPYIVVENGVARTDESAVARIWQLLMLAQLPFILWFAANWLPKDSKRALAMLAIQGTLFFAAALPVYLLEP
jgi:hypothetical protein